ncbi:MAG: hypothetical protein WCT03_07535 [Candidatus Obscuribacterales bacterium]|jgi:hypothetical protein
MTNFERSANEPKTINEKAREIVKEMDQSGDQHAQKAAEMLRAEFASPDMTSDQKRQLIIAIHKGEDKGVGADLQVASSTLSQMRANPKLENQLYVQLTTKDRPLGDSPWHGAPLYVAKTEPGMKSITPVSEMQNQAIHIARRMDDGNLHLAAEELRDAGRKMKPADFDNLLKQVRKEEAPNLGGDLLVTSPYVKPKSPEQLAKEEIMGTTEVPKPVVKSFEIYRTPDQTAKEQAAYKTTKSPQFETIAKKTDGLPDFTIVAGDPRLSF